MKSKSDVYQSLDARLAALSAEKRALLELRLQTKKKVSSPERIAPRQSKDTTYLPLSFAQQRLWFFEQFEPGHSFYNLPINVRFSSPISATILENALNEIINRHESLRTTFFLKDGEPVQIIASSLQIGLKTLDLSTAPFANRETEATQLATTEAMTPFNLEHGPLIRAKLLRLSEQDHILLITMHHIVSDGWSMNVLSRELTALYTAFSSGQASPLAELPMQYGDFAIWQRNYLRGDKLKTLLKYWIGKLDGMPDLIDLPLDRPRPRIQSFGGGSYIAPYSKTLIDSLKDFASQQESTLFMALLSIFKILLYRFSGTKDMVVGVPVANRNRVELEDLIGFFVNTLVLRTDLSGNPTFRQVLERVREVTLEAFTYQDLPFEKLVEEIQPHRNLSYNPLFQVMFGLQNTDTQLAAQNAQAQIAFGTSKFDLTLNATETEEGLTTIFEFNTELFDVQTITSLADTFGALLENVILNPDLPISELPLLSLEQRQNLIKTATTDGNKPRALLTHALFEAQVIRNPDAIAVEFAGEQLTYMQVDERANQLAWALSNCGVGPGVVVALCIDRCCELVISMLGVLKAGAAFVPLDPSYPKGRLSYMLDETKPPILLTRSHLANALPEFNGEVWSLDQDWSRIAQYSTEPLVVSVSPDDLAYIIFTSGSTGHPKGVMVPHRCVCNSAQAQIEVFNLPSDCRILQFGSLSFDTSIYDLLMAIGCGGTLCLMPQDSIFPGQSLAQTLLEQQINIITIPPSSLSVMPVTELPALHTIVSGGEAPTRDLIARWQPPGRRFFNAYGPTETTIWATVAQCEDASVIPSIGRPIANTQAYVLDEWLEPMPQGLAGELYLGGAGVSHGYLNRPEVTAASFIPDPFSSQPGARLYRTGDRAKVLANGEIQFLGRIDYQVKLRGFRIELGEIETSLLSHPSVREAVVVMQHSPSGEKRMSAYCVLKSGDSFNNKQLLTYLRQKLPEFMIPSMVHILSALPLNGSGKLDRAKLSVWTEVNLEPDKDWSTPDNNVEQKIVAIFQDILEINRIGSDDSFFELGGHSLLATRAITRINDAFEITLPLRTLFEFPTASALTRIVEQTVTEDSHPAQTAISKIPRQISSVDIE